MRLLCTLALALILACLTMLPTHAEKRVALVIGNGAYVNAPVLANPPNDGDAMARLLRNAGFDTVQSKTNLDIVSMRRALREFAQVIDGADVAVVFFAGHGIEVNGTNYLIPTDALLEHDIDVPDEAVSLDRINELIQGAKKLRLVILDACRANPFPTRMKRTIPTRAAIQLGFAKVEDQDVPPDTLIAFAARAGSTAADGAGQNSPYTTALLQHLVTAGVDVRIALGRVRDQVLSSTGGKQEPFVYGSLGGSEISLSPKATVEPAQPPATSQTTEAERVWSGGVKDTTSAAVLQDFIRRYPDTTFALMARERLNELTDAQHEAERVWTAIKETTSQAVLEDFIRRFGSTPYGSMARARIEELKRTQVSVLPPTPEPTQRPVSPNFPMEISGCRYYGDSSAKSMAVLAADTPSSIRAAELVEQLAKQNGINIRFVERAPLGTRDYSVYLIKAMAFGATIFYHCAPAEDQDPLSKQIAQFGVFRR